MKSGKTARSIEAPIAGFTFRREGYNIYILYIDPESIKQISIADKTKEYEFIQYSYYGAINNYNDLVKKSICLKYSIEDEISLLSKAIADPLDEEYLKYREFVTLCKNECNDNHSKLGLIK